MKSLSLCMIVRDEEKNLATCLNCIAKAVDEIIIVDTGSTDNTKSIARTFTDKVYDFEWVYDFSKARNFSFSKSTGDYIMWLDGDDMVLPDTVEKIKKWKESDEDVDVVMCSYVTSYDKDFNPTFEYVRERIVKNTPSLRFTDRVHEVIIPQGKVITRGDIKIYHNHKNKPYTDRNLQIYKKMLAEKIEFSPRQQFYYARELMYNNLLDQAIHEFSVFLADGKGWSENNIEACLNLSRCYQTKGEQDKALTSLFGSFAYGLPRGEILYEIGRIFEAKRQYKNAIYWYELAITTKPNVEGGGFTDLDCYNFLPALQLCVCYYKLGEKEKSHHYFEITKALKPEDPAVKYNEQFFNNK